MPKNIAPIGAAYLVLISNVSVRAVTTGWNDLHQQSKPPDNIMTPAQIITHVKSGAVDDEWGPTETKDLVRYFVASYCKWLTHENIAELTGCHQSTVSMSISKVKNNPKFTFIVRRLTNELNELLDKLKNDKPVYKWQVVESDLNRQRLLEY